MTNFSSDSDPTPELTTPRLLGAVVLGVWLWHAQTKIEPGLLGDMLWACHIAALIGGIGLLLRNTTLTAIGFLFTTGVGLTSYILDVSLNQSTTITSAALHFIPPATTAFALRGQTWPRWTPWAAAAIFPIMMFITRFVTAPEHNVNMSHAAWPPFDTMLSSLLLYQLINIALATGLVLLTDRLSRKIFRH